MKIVQVGVEDWLAFDDQLSLRYLIHHGPAVWRATGELLLGYDVVRWHLHRAARERIARFEYLAEAQAECARRIDLHERHEQDDVHRGPPNGLD